SANGGAAAAAGAREFGRRSTTNSVPRAPTATAPTKLKTHGPEDAFDGRTGFGFFGFGPRGRTDGRIGAAATAGDCTGATGTVATGAGGGSTATGTAGFSSAARASVSDPI